MELGNDKNYPEVPDSPTDVSKLQEDFCRVATNCEFRDPVIWPLQQIEHLTFRGYWARICSHAPCGVKFNQDYGSADFGWKPQ